MTAKLPTGVQSELDAAIQRTGMTDALKVASRRLPVMFHILPSEVEDWFAIVQEPDKNKVYESLDITELVP